MKECPSTAYAGESQINGRRQKFMPVMAAKVDVHRDLSVARARGAAGNMVAHRAAMTGIGLQRLAHTDPQRFERIQKGRVVPVLAPATRRRTPAHKFPGLEMGPAPAGHGKVFVRSNQHSGSMHPLQTLPESEAVNSCPPQAAPPWRALTTRMYRLCFSPRRAAPTFSSTGAGNPHSCWTTQNLRNTPPAEVRLGLSPAYPNAARRSWRRSPPPRASERRSISNDKNENG